MRLGRIIYTIDLFRAVVSIVCTTAQSAAFLQQLSKQDL